MNYLDRVLAIHSKINLLIEKLMNDNTIFLPVTASELESNEIDSKVFQDRLLTDFLCPYSIRYRTIDKGFLSSSYINDCIFYPLLYGGSSNFNKLKYKLYVFLSKNVVLDIIDTKTNRDILINEINNLPKTNIWPVLNSYRGITISVHVLKYLLILLCEIPTKDYIKFVYLLYLETDMSLVSFNDFLEQYILHDDFKYKTDIIGFASDNILKKLFKPALFFTPKFKQ